MTSKKELKTVLIISDAFGNGHFKNIKSLCSRGNYYFHKKENKFRFKFELCTDWHECPEKHYDVVLVDYGLLNRGIAIYKLKILFEHNCILVWCGGLGGGNYYNEDANNQFPYEEFLHNLKSCTIGHEEILEVLYRVLEAQK